MRSIRRILVAVKDPTLRSQPGVAKAAQLARALGASLELFHAITSPLYADLYSNDWKEQQKRLKLRVQERLDVLADRLKDRRLKVSSCAEWDFPAYEAVLRRAGTIQADLIVAERHAGRHFAPGFLHINDWELLRLASVPLLLVKSSTVYRNPVVLAAVDPSHADKPATLDSVILDAGATIAASLRGKLHAMYAHPAVFSGTHETDAFSPAVANRLNAEFAAKATVQFDRLLKSRRIPSNRRHLSGNDPADAIQQIVRKTHANIVIMGAISRSGLKRIFIGNTAERVLDRLTCDLLIVKPPKFANRISSTPAGVRLIPLTPVIP